MSDSYADPIIQGVLLTKGTEILVKGKQGKFRYILLSPRVPPTPETLEKFFPGKRSRAVLSPLSQVEPTSSADASLTSAGKIVLNLIGPVGAHEHWGACYADSVKRVYRK